MIRYKMSSVWGITGSIRAVSGLYLAARHLVTVIVMEKIMRDDTSEATAVKYSPSLKDKRSFRVEPVELLHNHNH